MRQIDGKYKTDGNITKLDGTPIPDDEPLVLFRAKDKLLPQLLEDYKKLCQDAGCQSQQVETLGPLIQQAKDWQAANPDKVKLPD
jgi:hypothetical protein